MKKVYIRVHFDLIYNLNNFFKKLKEFVGDFTIEHQQLQDINILTIIFYADNFQFEEGETRQLDILAEFNKDGDWFFTTLRKIGQ